MLRALLCFTIPLTKQFTWLLDAQPIMDLSLQHRYAIGQYVDASGDVIAHLNISHVRADDGGLYKCIATNSMGSVEHAARLNVYGKCCVNCFLLFDFCRFIFHVQCSCCFFIFAAESGRSFVAKLWNNVRIYLMTFGVGFGVNVLCGLKWTNKQKRRATTTTKSAFMHVWHVTVANAFSQRVLCAVMCEIDHDVCGGCSMGNLLAMLCNDNCAKWFRCKSNSNSSPSEWIRRLLMPIDSSIL